MYDVNENKSDELVLIIPDNVNTKFEVFPGIGYKELAILAVATMLGFLLFMFLGVFKRTELINVNDLSFTERVGLSNEELSNVYIERKVDIFAVPIRLMFAITPPIFCYFLLKTDSGSNISFYKQLSYKKAYDKSQKRYLYTINS